MLLEELGQEIADITSAWEWAILQKDFDLLNGQLESLYIYYWARNEFHDGRFAFEQAAEMIRNHVPRKQLLLARMQSKLAEFLAWLGDIESAQKLIQENLSVFRKSHNREYLASELCLRGMTYYWQGQYCQARDAFTEAIELARPIGAKHHLAHAITGLANAICDENADYDDAFELYQESLEIYKELGNEHGIAMNLINQGAILYEQDHYQQAEQLFQQSLDIYRRVDYSYGISAALNYLAGVNRKLGNFESAKELTAESLSLNYETGNRRSILDSLLEIGMLGMEMENYAEAQGYFCEAMQLTLDIGSPELGLKVILGFAGLFEKTGKTERSAELVTFVLAQNGGGQEIREQADDLWAKLEKKLSPVVMERCRSIVKKMDFSDIVADLFCED
jgi:tetratricopeptide (TPR) repeat protein